MASTGLHQLARRVVFQYKPLLTSRIETSCKESSPGLFRFFSSLGENLTGFFLLCRGGGASFFYNTSKSS